MLVSDYIVKKIGEYGVKDAFGIPGGVLLRLIYSMNKKAFGITPHLSYHEQMAGFAACGYAQASGKLAIAYATRGPGIANMITCMAEAYQESLPVLFITAHGSRTESNVRFENNQELDLVKCVSKFTKYAKNIDTINDLPRFLYEACYYAVNGRKGPVFLDFATKLFSQSIDADTSWDVQNIKIEKNDVEFDNPEIIMQSICNELERSARPVFLIGDGLRYCGMACSRIEEVISKLHIPILSSRAAQDIASQSPYYFGYIGSHGVRYSNFILSKADLIIALGNRMAFPSSSKSFAPITRKAKIIQLDADREEVKKGNYGIPGMSGYHTDARIILKMLDDSKYEIRKYDNWIEKCEVLKKHLMEYDMPEPVRRLSSFLARQNGKKTYVCDVGNNEFWFSRAFEKEHPEGTVLYSKAFGTLGVALGRAIGAYYATGESVVCIIGDQGFQYNIQELQYIKQWNLPIKIVLLNNSSSAMIADHESKLFEGILFHTTEETGYGTPLFEKVLNAYDINYTRDEDKAIEETKSPILYEIQYDREGRLIPMLPKGNTCQNMEPLLDKELYDYLDNL